VRSNAEWAGGYIPGAKHIPVDDIPTRMAEIDKSKTVLLYCAAGGRSHRAMEMLKAAGYRDVRHLADGISGWKAAGLTITK
jgi:rhodanese-related sulfurtransferase